MTNRLRNILRETLLCAVLLWYSTLTLCAQSSAFNFIPPSPNVFSVGPACWRAVASTPMPVVTSTLGATIVVSQFAATNTYAYNDPWPAPTTLLVKWYVEDNLGNSHEFNYGVTFIDDIAPVFDLTGIPSSLNFQSVVQVPPPPNIPVSDNCLLSNLIMVTFTESTRPDTCLAGSFTRTWTAKDTFDNVTTFVQTITIEADLIPPVVSWFPVGDSVACSIAPAAYQAWLATQVANFAASDPSGIKALTNNAPPTFPVGCSVPRTVTFRAIDNCNLIYPVTVVFKTVDVATPKVVVAPKDTVAYCSPTNNHLSKLHEWINKRAYSQTFDSCSLPQMYRMEMNGVAKDSAQVVAAFLDSISLGSGCGARIIGGKTYPKIRAFIDVDFYAKDACGNEVWVGDAIFAASDTLKPVITGVNTLEQCGTTANDQANLQAWINAHGNATVSDDCSSTVWTNFSYSTSDGQNNTGLFGVGPFPQVKAHNCTWFADLTFRATDECGNIGQKTLRFQIQDTQKPVIAGFPDTVTVLCTNPVPVLPKQYITDNCDTNMVVSFTAVLGDSLCDGSFTMTVTWSATDDCGNFGTAKQTVLVRDTVAPVFTLVPPNKTFYCDTFVLPAVPVMGVNIQATDNCSPVLSITTQTNSQQNPNPALCGHYNYTILRTFTATDECGNTRTATQVLTIIDNVPPLPQGIFDTIANCEVLPTIPLPPPTAVDACSGPTAAPLLLTQVTTPGACTDAYTVTLTWRAADVCGNTTTFTQVVHVQDTVAPQLFNIPPNITVDCKGIPPAPATTSFSPTDNCDNSVTIQLLETEIRNPDTTNCDHWTDYVLRREWTASDNCGNTRRYTQNIQIDDATPPVIVPQAQTIVPSTLDSCGAFVSIPPPLSLYDVCTSKTLAVSVKDTAFLVNTTGQPNNIVDTLKLQWTVPNLSPNEPVVGNLSLNLSFTNSDINSATEFFRVFGENATLLAATTPAGGSACIGATAVVSITAAQANEWLKDGILNILLAPNTSGDPVNAICPGAKVVGTINYTYNKQYVPIGLKFSIDAGLEQNYPPAGPIYLETGLHTVEYTASDCAGNTASASTILDVRDVQAPKITAPAPQTAYVNSTDGCTASFTLPFPQVDENCNVSNIFTFSSANIPVVFSPDNLPEDVVLNMTGLSPNAVEGGRLVIRHLGDNHDNGEFFKVFDENSVSVFPGNTSLGSLVGECALFHETVFPVSAAQINAWAANGSTSFMVVANNNIAFPDLIGPCQPLLPDMTDGVSRLEAKLLYAQANITYEIRKGVNGPFAVPPGQLNGGLTTVLLPPGPYTVKYSVTDINGLTGSTTYPLVVRDTIKPVAKCKPTFTVQINPVGTAISTVTLSPLSINNNSTDNCSALSLSVSPNVFNCSDATSPNNPFVVTLTVKDTSNNTSTCTSLVEVENSVPLPSYNAPVCEGEQLQLFANPPGSGTGPTFDYFWSHNSGPTFSSAQNPIVSPAATQANAGVYNLMIRGITGCTATASLVVTVGNFPAPNISTSSVNVCFGQNITLAATPPPGGGIPNLQYRWFVDSLPNDIQLASTTLSTYSIPMPPVGVYKYYVRYASGSCLSLASNVITVRVYPVPVANPSPTSILVCEGQPISLGVTSVTPQATYGWTGPNNFSALNTPFPLVTPSADSMLHDGNYILTVTQNGCASPPVTVPVEVKTKPSTPVITGDGTVCVGDNVTMTYNLPPGESINQYEWMRPDGTTFVVMGLNAYTVQNVTLDSTGNWRLRVYRLGCPSNWSAPFVVSPQAYPDVTASVNNPVCMGDTIKLSANSNVSLPTVGGWFWSGVNTAFVQYTQSTFVVPNMAGTYTYKVIGRRENGCQDSAFVTTTVVARPDIVLVQNNAPVCWDGITSASLSAIVNAPNPIQTYQWFKDGVPYSNDPIPVIPGNQPIASFNGVYSLVITDVFGCKSTPKNTVVNSSPPLATPTISAGAAVCEGQSVLLSIQSGGQYPNDALFTWLRPNKPDTTTTTAFLNLPNPTTATMSGQYSVFVSTAANNCKSDTSQVSTVTIYPTPALPNAISNSPVCEGGTFAFNVSPAASDVTYEWGGVGGFNIVLQNPTRLATASNEGLYWVTAKSKTGHCLSKTDTIFADVLPLPNTPFVVPATEANNPKRLCFAQPGASVVLNITAATQTTGATYTWTRIPGNQVVAGPMGTTNVTLDSLAPGTHKFRVQANLNGCLSMLSDTAFVEVDVVPPSTAEAGENKVGCISLATPNISLDGIAPNIGTGLWSQIGGPPVSFINAGVANTQISGAQDGHVLTLVWTLSNGACMNYDADTVVITARKNEDAYAGLDTMTCATDGIKLNASASQHGGYWTQSPGNLLPDDIFADSLNPKTLVSGLRPGNPFTFYWNIQNYGCGDATDDVIVRVYSAKPDAGSDFDVCAQDSCTIVTASLFQPSFETGKWIAPGLSFPNGNSNSTRVCGLKVGENVLIWELNNGVCGSNSRDTVVVDYQLFPTAENDEQLVDFGAAATLNVLSNDNVPEDYQLFILSQPAHGQLDSSVFATGLITYTPFSGFTGTDVFFYRLRNLNCPESGSTGKVSITVSGAPDCIIYNVITPNSDGLNETFVIPAQCVLSGDGLLKIDLTIFNQWGDFVYRSEDYQNDWDGTRNGDPLPEGTYYYLIKEVGGITKDKATGFLLIKR